VVLLDLQGTQSAAHGGRGIGRYLTELATALEQWHSGAVTKYVLDPRLPYPPEVRRLIKHRRTVTLADLDGAEPRIYHVGSPFELDLPIDAVWPRAVRRRARLVVTLYDLIPLLFPRDPATRRRYFARLELVRRADRLLALSEATARDAAEHLKVAAERIRVVGAAPSEHFRPGASEEPRLPGIEPGYVFYTGGIDPRKNIPRLLRAYARLPGPLRSRHQLVVVCAGSDDELAALRADAASVGAAERVLFPGFVSDETLVSLYQACELFVFPSLYEGYGLPVAEAMACGAPVIAARTSSLPELVADPRALFDPLDIASMAETLERALTDEQWRQELRQQKLDHTWRGVAERTAAVYDELAATS
jgi:glycosyltransferase involved in cell wall biosynthesis